MLTEYLVLEKSPALYGSSELHGAKNAVLVIMTASILASGVTTLRNVPTSQDVFQMIHLLELLGAVVAYDDAASVLTIDSTGVRPREDGLECMKKMRASVLILGPLLARFSRASIALPGGCILGPRPVDFHLKAFAYMGATLTQQGDYVHAHAPAGLTSKRFILPYPSVGATENIIMAATITPGLTTIINAAIEPEVLDLIRMLTAMGALITIKPAGTIEVEGVCELKPVDHTVIMDRLEAGTLLVATAVSGGEISLPQAPAYFMEVFLEKLSEMGHTIDVGIDGIGINLRATQSPRAVSFKTMPYPGFPTDLQAPMMVAQCLADGTSEITETVFENRMLHARELQKMGAQITLDGMVAKVSGVDMLYGSALIASDIRASAALVIAGIVAEGTSTMSGVHHVLRGYQDLCGSLQRLGARITTKQH